MRIFRALLTVAIVALCSLAFAGQHDWVVSKLPTDLSNFDASEITVGTINSQRYIAIHLNVGDETQANFKPVLVLARIDQDNTYKPLQIIELPNLAALSVQIKDGAIYIRNETAHHGIYFTSYQFKPHGKAFHLSAMERQSITPAQYAGIMENIELWEGVSVDFAVSRATYWARAFAQDNTQARQKAHRLFTAGRKPRERIQRTVRISHAKHGPIDIEDFDPFQFEASFLCHYFDHKLRFHNACK